jgi:DMSO/TMAO reductase YedYZ molybdopterin-dependent catalytic subunit
MALFIVRHEHAAERCPATDPSRGAELLNYLSRSQVNRHGVEIHGEAIVDGQHTLYMILQAADETAVYSFMTPFALAGTVEVHPASTCAKVVAGGGCLGPAPPLDRSVPALDPEEACQEAVDGGLVVHRAHPLNCETSLPALIGGVVMPNARFYVRNHFQIPLLEPATWRLDVGGLVERPLRLGLRELQTMRAQSVVVTLECAGNGRSLLRPPAEGEQWGLGAVSTAEWTGVPLVEVLDRAGLDPCAVEVVFRGVDRGTVNGSTPPVRFERSLSVADAQDSGAVLAYAMNGEPLPVEHGRPVRLIVPGWYAMASVKWLTEIDVVDHAFTGHFQTEKYVYERERDGRVEREPVTLQQVRALIIEPHPGEDVTAGDVAVRGMAWSGAAPLARVEVSIADGPWQSARLVGERHRHSWQWWELLTRLEEPGPTTIRARATDLAGRTQPAQAEWNALGYGANAIQQVTVCCRHP